MKNSNLQKVRLDQLLVERGLVNSREKAQALILAGEVLVNDVPLLKSGVKFTASEAQELVIRLRNELKQYVSRGALKLKKAIEFFDLSEVLKGKTALDVGSSTGGFTEVLLEYSVAKVFAVDVGTNQLDYKIRSDTRVVVLEKTNARNLTFDVIGQKVDAIVMDVSFISIEKIVPALIQFAHPDTEWILLIKPQFEAGPNNVGEGGVVRDEHVRLSVVERVSRELDSLGLLRRGLVESPIRGQKGNVEYLSYWRVKK